MHLTSLLTANFKKRDPYLKQNNIEAYRLLSPSQKFPLAIDIYKDNAVIQVFSPMAKEFFKEIEKALNKILSIINVFYKNRTKLKIDLPQTFHKEIDIHEYGHTFHINLSDYVDAGLFLDHRETRRFIEKQSKGKKVLNTFAYTGSFSIYGAAGGALLTHSVDLSKTYCEWIKKNLAQNQLSPEKNWVYKMDIREYFNYALRKKLFFDIIIIDPPTFSRNKGHSFSVQKDHPVLINGALKILAPGGFILFSTNYREFRYSTKQARECRIEEITKKTIPPDFEGTIPHRTFLIKK